MGRTAITHLLDTSALVAHFNEEAGWQDIDRLLAADPPVAAVCVVTWFEFRILLASWIADKDEQETILTLYQDILETAYPVTRDVTRAAYAVREFGRIPLADAFIAGCAKVHGLTLVHRDQHLKQIPPEHVLQLQLPGTT